MSATPMTVLILDDDLGFCMWLGRVLNEAGIRALPACRSDQVLQSWGDPSYPIDLVIVNPQIDGCREVLAQNRGAKIIAIGGAGTLAVDGVLRRPHGRALPPPDRYIKVVRDVLRRDD